MLICIGLNRRHRSGVETLAATAQLRAIVSLEQPFSVWPAWHGLFILHRNASLTSRKATTPRARLSQLSMPQTPPYASHFPIVPVVSDDADIRCYKLRHTARWRVIINGNLTK